MQQRLALAVTVATIGACALPAAGRAQGAAPTDMQPPPAGSVYSFACTDQDGKSYNEEYKIAKSGGDNIRVEVQTGGRRNSYEKPVYAMGTTIVERETVDGQERTMSGIGSFSALRKLAPGTNVSTYVTERRGSNTRIPWNYTVSVQGREVVYNREFGDLGVIVINEDRWAELYSSSMQSQFAPQINFPIYWRYKDSNNAAIECKLATATGITPATATAIVAAAPPPAAAAPAKAAPTPPPPRPAVAAPAAAPSPPPSPYASTPPAAAPARPATSIAAAPPPPPPAPAPAARPASAPATAPAPSASGDAAKQARLNQLQDLLRQGVITREEFARKEREILTESPAGNIAQELAEANRLFRDRRVTQEEFVQRRARALAKITPGEMQPKDALILLNQLLEAQLISPTEHRAKRTLMLSAL